MSVRASCKPHLFVRKKEPHDLSNSTRVYGCGSGIWGLGLRAHGFGAFEASVLEFRGVGWRMEAISS